VPTGRVDPPSSSFQTYTEGNVFRISVPSNWRERPGGGAVTFAPDGAYGDANGQSVFTHGVRSRVVAQRNPRSAAGDRRADRFARGRQSAIEPAIPGTIA
jgi:hypothetical protein